MSKKCGYTVPAIALDESYPFNLKEIAAFIRGMLSANCVYTVSAAFLDDSDPSKLKKN